MYLSYNCIIIYLTEVETIGLVVIATAVAQNHCIYIVTLFMPIVNTYTKL